jgi:hypothetical protein
MTPLSELEDLESAFGSEWETELEAEASDGGPWSASPEQLAFRESVLKAHLARTSRIKGAPKPDLRSDQLAPVAGTPVTMRSDAASAAAHLLQAANADLAQARAAGDPDAARTIRISGVSGYRGSDHQRTLWRRYFPRYYNQTRNGRALIAQGPHSVGAVSYMLDKFGIPNRIAAPGYSNHQAGVAIDFLQERVKGSAISNSYDAQQRWRSSWFYRWLRANASRFGFAPYEKEAWHWEYRSGRAPAAQEMEWESAASHEQYLGGLIRTYTSTAVPPAKIAVFCPAAAVSKKEVDVLVYAHGLLYGPCAAPKEIPAGLIDKPPFDLGGVVHKSGRPVVLVVPLFDWQRQPYGRQYKPATVARTLGEPANLNRLVDEALSTVGAMRNSSPPSLARLILAGHSRGYDFLEPLAAAHGSPEMNRGALAKLARVWALDSTYPYRCEPRNWSAWLNEKPGLRVSVVFRKGTGTAGCAGRLQALKGTGGRLAFSPLSATAIGHCDVPARALPGLLNGLGPAGQPEGEAAWSDAMMEHLAHLAAHAESEQEAAGHLLPLVGFATAKLLSHAGDGAAPEWERAAPAVARAVTRVAPQLTRGVGRIARNLYRKPGGRELLRTIPSITRRTVYRIAADAGAGRPVTGQGALRTLARQTVDVLGNRPRRLQALSSSRAIEECLHRCYDTDYEPEPDLWDDDDLSCRP